MVLDLIDALWRRVREHTLARIGKNAVALFVAQAGARLLNLVLIAQLTRAVGVASLGRYLSVMTLEAITLSLVDLGLNTFTIREFARAPARRSPREAGALWGAVLSLKLLAALCGVLILNAVVAPILYGGRALSQVQRRVLVAVGSVALLPDAFNGSAIALIKARQRMEISGAITLAMRLVATLSGALLVRLGHDERALLISYGVSSLLGSVAFAVVLWTWRTRPRWTGCVQRWGQVLREALPFAVTGIAGVLYARMDLLMLSWWQGDMAAGLYGLAHRLWEALGMVPSSFLDALFPELSRASYGGHGQAGPYGRDRARLQALYCRGRLVMVCVIGLLVVPCLLAAPYMMALFYGGKADLVSTTLFRCLLLVFPFTHLYLLNGHVLYAAGQQRRVTGVMVVVTLIKGLLNALVIPTWSYWGAVGVTLTSEVLLFVLLGVASERYALRSRSASEDGH